MAKAQLFFAYTAQDYWQQDLFLQNEESIETLICRSDFAQRFPEYDYRNLGLSVFGRKVELDYRLRDGDRVELCRQLSFDPKESRKRRAQHRQAGILKKKHLQKDHRRQIEVDLH